MIFDNDYSKIIISGAGPAGCSASFFLSKKGIKHTIIEKEQFPREKICGDAISGKVINILKKIDSKLVEFIEENRQLFNPSKGVIFISPNFTKVEIPFKSNYSKDDKAPGYVAKRIDFDNFLFKNLDKKYCKIIENCSLTNAENIDNGIVITVKHENKTYSECCKILIAADGAKSIISKKLANNKIDYKHYSAGTRAYFSGVKDLNKDGFIELIFLEEYIPGYLWIFPLPNGKANVGVGMLSQKVKENKIDLKVMFENTIKKNPKIASRFEKAIQETPLLGWGLPLGSKKMKLSGSNFLLCGDAASLIDPFTGEGIAPAMLSGMIAADVVDKALNKNDFSDKYLKIYDKQYYKATSNETKISYILQKLINYKWLFNFVLRKISNNKELKKLITMMFSDINLRKKITSPAFYFRLILKK